MMAFLGIVLFQEVIGRALKHERYLKMWLYVRFKFRTRTHKIFLFTRNINKNNFTIGISI